MGGGVVQSNDVDKFCSVTSYFAVFFISSSLVDLKVIPKSREGRLPYKSYRSVC